jgi:hypothetical protein
MFGAGRAARCVGRHAPSFRFFADYLRIEICDHDSSVELDQVLKDQLTPAISARLHKQSTFRKAA